ncbi:MAG: hypothetical protein Q9187_009572, partial [Circinaria calcarea]
LGHDRHLYALFCVWQRALDDEGAEAASSNGMSSNGRSSPTDGVSDKAPTSQTRNSISPDHGSPSRHSPPPQLMPAIFADAGWDKINNTILSTSNCGNPSLRQFGFGPTSGDGFGIGYIIKDDSIAICASSKHRQTKRFVDALESYLLEIRKLLRMTQRKATSPKTSRAREKDEAPNVGRSLRGRGRMITAEAGKGGIETPQSSGSKEESDDELGGYGFFDSGMLLQALKASQEEETKPSQKAVGQARKAVGKKLRLSEY